MSDVCHVCGSVAPLRDALETVLEYREGRGRFNFASLSSFDRDNAMFDAWQEVEQKIRDALASEPDTGAQRS